MLSWIIVLAGLGASWHYTDLESQTALYSVVFPLLFLVFAAALAIKIVVFLNPSKGRANSNNSSTGFWGDSGGSDWGGGSDGGCGGGGD
ncbi:hypothetical protein GCM10025791_22500 [Halioxenophilus aromaticivorans]|uniref:Uncharacterized protein n=1 Tax=Halioxenophilus aromaticivorans TaxID=1306992 RepID=A0AAV3U2F7_9ALTE